MPKTKSISRGLQNVSVGKLSRSNFKQIVKNLMRLKNLNKCVISCNHAPPNINYKKRKFSSNNLLVPN